MINTLIYIIDLASKIYIAIILLRFLLQMSRADFYNPISQFIVKVTHPLLAPLRKIIPPIFKQDTSCLILSYLIQVLSVTIIFMLAGMPINLFVLTKVLLIAILKWINLIFYILFLLFIGSAILSWIASDSRVAPARLIRQLCEFILAPLRRVIPPLGIFDITPMIALIILMFINRAIEMALSPYILKGLM